MKARPKYLLAGILAALHLTAFAAEPHRIYVAPDGDDASAGTAQVPVKTLAQAQRLARKQLKKQDAPVTVMIKPGRYVLDQTLVLSKEDASPSGHPVIYQGTDPKNRPVLCSDIPVTGWKRVEADVPYMSSEAKGKLWVADIPKAALGRGKIATMYDGDKPLRISAKPFKMKFVPVRDVPGAKSREDIGDRVYYPDGVLRQYENLEDIEFSLYTRQKWMHLLIPIVKIDPDQQIAFVARKQRWGLAGSPIHRKYSVAVLNTIDHLDEPGEWCVNTKTGKIYYWPKDGEPSANINIPGLYGYIRVEGNHDVKGPKDDPVKNIHIKDIAFTKGKRNRIELGDAVAHSEWAIYDKDNAVLRFRGAEDCTADNVLIENSGDCGIRMDLHCQRVVVANSTIRNIGRTGVVILGYGPGTKDVNGHNKVVNCTIHDVGQHHRNGHAVIMAQTHDSVVSHCKIYNTPMNSISIVGLRYWVTPHNGKHHEYKAIRWHELPEGARKRVLEENLCLDAEAQTVFFGFRNVGSHEEFLESKKDYMRWRTQTDWYDYEDYVHTRNNRVEFSDISHFCQDLGDSNAVYLHTANEGNTVYYNYIHDAYNNELSTAIRTDNVQRHAVFSHNIIANMETDGGINASYETEIYNNYIVNLGERPELRERIHLDGSSNKRKPRRGYGRDKKYIMLHGGMWPNFSKIRRNIMLATDGPFGGLAIKPKRQNENFKVKQVRVNHNIYYSQSAGLEKTKEVFTHGPTAFGRTDVVADPLFEDLKTFKLSKDSPAHAMGIEQLDITKMGLLEKPYKVKR